MSNDIQSLISTMSSLNNQYLDNKIDFHTYNYRFNGLMNKWHNQIAIRKVDIDESDLFDIEDEIDSYYENRMLHTFCKNLNK